MDIAGCRAALRAHVPGLPAKDVRLLGEGWDSTAFLVNGRHVVRFPKRPDVAASLVREARLLRELTRLVPVAVPWFTFVTDGGGENGLAFAGYPLVAGVPLEHVSLPGAARQRLAVECGRFLRALHAFPLARARALGFDTLHLCSGPAGWAAFRRRAETAAAPLLTGEERAALARWFDSAEATGITSFDPVLTHADLGDDHLLVDPETGALTGVIDWSDATIGDPAMDFAGLLNALGAVETGRALAAYGSGGHEDMLRRARIYIDAAPLHELIFAVETNDPMHLRPGLRRLRALLG